VRLLPLLITGLVSLGASACGSDDNRKPTFPVTGSLLIDQKPGEHATVIFHPVSNEPGEVVKPRGKVRNDGTFTLTTYAENDGAPVGEYQVTVELWLAGRPDEGPTSRLPAKLAKPESSGLKATIKNEPNALEPFTVTKR
jgi:hypothetical protein